MAAPVRMSIQVQVTGNEETRISNKSGKPYTQAEAFASIPGIQYPQRFKFYCETPNQVPRAGFYECEVQLSIKNDNLDFRVDPRQGRLIADVKSPAQTA